MSSPDSVCSDAFFTSSSSSECSPKPSRHPVSKNENNFFIVKASNFQPETSEDEDNGKEPNQSNVQDPIQSEHFSNIGDVFRHGVTGTKTNMGKREGNKSGSVTSLRVMIKSGTDTETLNDKSHLSKANEENQDEKIQNKEMIVFQSRANISLGAGNWKNTRNVATNSNSESLPCEGSTDSYNNLPTAVFNHCNNDEDITNLTVRKVGGIRSFSRLATPQGYRPRGEVTTKRHSMILIEDSDRGRRESSIGSCDSFDSLSLTDESDRENSGNRCDRQTLKHGYSQYRQMWSRNTEDNLTNQL